MQQGWVPSSSNKAGVPLGEKAAHVPYFLTEGNREKPFWSLPVATSAVTPTVRIKDSSDVSFPVAICKLVTYLLPQCVALYTLLSITVTQGKHWLGKAILKVWANLAAGSQSNCPACKPLLWGECTAAQLYVGTGRPPAL